MFGLGLTRTVSPDETAYLIKYQSHNVLHVLSDPESHNWWILNIEEKIHMLSFPNGRKMWNVPHCHIRVYFKWDRQWESEHAAISQFAQKTEECISLLEINSSPHSWGLPGSFTRKKTTTKKPKKTPHKFKTGGVLLLPINSLRLTRLSTSVKDVALWSKDSVVASSRSVTHKTRVMLYCYPQWVFMPAIRAQMCFDTWDVQLVVAWCVSDNTADQKSESQRQRRSDTPRPHTHCWLGRRDITRYLTADPYPLQLLCGKMHAA